MSVSRAEVARFLLDSIEDDTWLRQAPVIWNDRAPTSLGPSRTHRHTCIDPQEHIVIIAFWIIGGLTALAFLAAGLMKATRPSPPSSAPWPGSRTTAAVP